MVSDACFPWTPCCVISIIAFSCLLVICLLPPFKAFYSNNILTSSSSYSKRLRYFKTTSWSNNYTRFVMSSMTSVSIDSAILTLLRSRSYTSSTLKSGCSMARRMHLHANSSKRGDTSTAAHILPRCTIGLLTFTPSQNSSCSLSFFYEPSTAFSPSLDCFEN